MRFQWNGSTWTTGAEDSPSFPLDTADNTEVNIQRTYAGAARLVYRWRKRVLDLAWDNVGSLTAQTHVRNMISSGGTVNIAYADGTFDAFPDANSLRTTESAYSLYTITARFVEI